MLPRRPFERVTARIEQAVNDADRVESALAAKVCPTWLDKLTIGNHKEPTPGLRRRTVADEAG